MEIIKWVVTPPCRSCDALPEYTRRRSCFGCERLHRKDEPCVKRANHKLTKADMLLRNARIASMREEGLSYDRIAGILKMPRGTVQSAAAAFKRMAAAK